MFRESSIPTSTPKEPHEASTRMDRAKEDATTTMASRVHWRDASTEMPERGFMVDAGVNPERQEVVDGWPVGAIPEGLRHPGKDQPLPQEGGESQGKSNGVEEPSERRLTLLDLAAEVLHEEGTRRASDGDEVAMSAEEGSGENEIDMDASARADDLSSSPQSRQGGSRRRSLLEDTEGVLEAIEKLEDDESGSRSHEDYHSSLTDLIEELEMTDAPSSEEGEDTNGDEIHSISQLIHDLGEE